MATVQAKEEDVVERESLSGDANRPKISDIIEPVCVPREPCANWLTSMSGKIVSNVACGGQHTMAVTVGEKMGVALGRKLLKASALTKRLIEEGDDASSSEDDEDNEDESGHDVNVNVSQEEALDKDDDDNDSFDDVASAHSSMFSTKNSLMAQGATADCVMLVAGKRIYAHKVVLSKRCSKLRNLIYEEHRDGEDGLTELILPDLRFDVARCLVQFLYTDDVSSVLDPATTLPYDLMKAGEEYGLKRLVMLCKAATAFAQYSLPERGEGEQEDDGDNENGNLSAEIRRRMASLLREEGEIVIPPSTLSADFGGALGESEYADVKFVANGKFIYAHRCILAARSSYFSGMFRSGSFDAGSGKRRKGMLEIQVPDSYVGLLRVLVFVYCGNLADSNADAVLEDLLAADRYALFDMKRSCESTIKVTASNAAAVLDVACVLDASRLKAEAASVLARRLRECSEPDGGESLRELCKRVPPEVMPRVMDMIMEREQHHREARGGINKVEKLVVELGVMAGREIGITEEVREKARAGLRKKKEREVRLLVWW